MFKKVAFTMYPIEDVARARAFYEETLGLTPGLAGGQGGVHWIEYDLPGGGCLAITNAGDGRPGASGATIALGVTQRLSRGRAQCLLGAIHLDLPLARFAGRDEHAHGPVHTSRVGCALSALASRQIVEEFQPLGHGDLGGGNKEFIDEHRM